MILSVSEICTLIGIEEKQFLKFSKRYEQKITDLGYNFIKEGKGKKAIYTLDKPVTIKEHSNSRIKELLISEYGFNGRYKIDEYIKLIEYIINSNGFNTNAEIGQAMDLNEQTIKRYIKTLREKLILKPKNTCQVRYYGIKIGTYKDVLDITKEMFEFNYHQQFYYQESACENCIGQARKEILEYLGVINIWKLYKNEFSNAFLNRIMI